MEQPDLRVRDMEVDALIPYAHNAKTHTDEQVAQIAASIEEFGFNDPIAIWGTEIVEGHGRILAAKKLGMETVPVIRLDHLTDEQRRAYTHVHNQLTMNTPFDEELLAAELEELDFDWDALGFDMGEEDEEPEFTEDDGFDESPEPRCKPGDVWVLGNHRLVCGDSTDPKVWAKLMRGGQDAASLMVTDPPYNVDIQGQTTDKLTIQNDNLADDDFRKLLDGFMQRADENMLPGASFYIWHASRTQRQFEDAINGVGMEVREQIIWNKSCFTLGRQDYQWKHEPCFYGWKDGAAHYYIDDRTKTTVWDFDKPSRNADHPTMKPVALIGECIANSSKRGDIVIDPFGGSGSTLIACEQSGRLCRTIELDPHYCDVIISRWEAETGDEAVLEK